MGSIIGHRIGYNGVGALRDQRTSPGQMILEVNDVENRMEIAAMLNSTYFPVGVNDFRRSI